jgi:hypothetical protein
MTARVEKLWSRDVGVPRRRMSAPSPRLRATDPPVLAAEAAALTAPTAAPSSFAALLTAHILRDGEIVLLALKPSIWFILLQSLPVTLAILIAYFIARAFTGLLARPAYVEAMLILVAARFVWATMHWMGRWYVLTDQRIIRVAGVFRIDVYDCALRKIAHTQLTTTLREQAFRLASIEFHPKDSAERANVGVWQMISHPERIHERINEAIQRAQCSG